LSGIAQTTSDSILGVIRKESWIRDHFEIFVTIAFNGAYGKPLQNRRWCCHLANNIALAEVCGLWLLSSFAYFLDHLVFVGCMYCICVVGVVSFLQHLFVYITAIYSGYNFITINLADAYNNDNTESDNTW